jgi:hypothetical protein
VRATSSSSLSVLLIPYVLLSSSVFELNTFSLSTLLQSFVHSSAFLSFHAELIKVIRGKPIAKPAPAKGKK